MTQIQPESLQSSGIPWWAIWLAVIGGLLLLGLLTYGLYKVRPYVQDFPANFSNMHAPVFVHSQAASQANTWIYLFCQAGFFKRKKMEEMKAQQEQNDKINCESQDQNHSFLED